MLPHRIIFASSQDYLTAELREMIEVPESPLQPVLALPYIAKVAKIGFPVFQKYMSTKCNELLKFAFADELSLVSTNAYKILSCGDKTYLKPILEDGSYCDLATEMLTHADVPSFLIARLSSLTLTLLLNLPDLACEACGYIYHLLKYCENPTVFNLFEALTGSDPNVAPAQEWLKNLGFDAYIEREVMKIDFGYKSEGGNVFKDPVYNRACYLFILIGRSSENSIMGDSFKTANMVRCLSSTFENQPDFVTTAQWRAIIAITCEKTAPTAITFLRPALNMLTEPFTKLLEYRVSALIFITKMMNYSNLTLDLLLESQMPQMLINLVLQFENSTILHNAFLDFVELGVQEYKFTSQIINFYVPVVITYGESEENRVVKPCCIKVMEIFLKVAKKDKRIAQVLDEQAGVRDFVTNVVEPYNRKISTAYGGEFPIELKFFKSLFG